MLTKIRFSDEKYKMGGSSFGFTYKGDYNGLYDVVLKGLQKVLEVYSFPEESIVYVQLIIKEINRKLISDILLDKTNIDKKSLAFINRLINLFPVTNNEKLLGDKLDNIEIIDDKVSNIDINCSGEKISFMENIRKQNEILKYKNKPDVEFTNDYDFYLRDGHNKPTVLAVKKEGNIYTKEAYTLDGVSLGNVKDEIVVNTKGSLNVTDSSNNVEISVLRKSLNICFKKIFK